MQDAQIERRKMVTLPQEEFEAILERAAERGAQTYVNLPGLLRKNYWLSEDGMRAGGIYVWESKARAEAFYTAEWKQVVTRQYGVAPEIVYLLSPVMVDNTAGRIVTDGA
ncbi:MAG: YdhR family protein [Candidatus Accumulibacter sp.]|uniref:YdhR family protein n=1 Tax=Candidatus Accumulibacter affinis TaxID=2954384 RepID=A0A935TFT7_9PROT|nr:YdhR family protein [Candidatus Accumulibacter affinis]